MSYDPAAPDPFNVKPDWEVICDCKLFFKTLYLACEACPDLTKCWGPDTLPNPKKKGERK